eukprot:jgi/Undpi1/12060/HiC_scaffold_4.g01758.m1
MREADTTTITTMMATACKEGSLSDLRELLEADVGVTASTLKVPQVAVDQAAGAGHTEIDTLEWAHAREIQCFGPELMDVAAWQGRLAVLKWLHKNREDGCAANAVPWAARRGRLKVLRWLRSTLGQACTAEGLEAASTAGHPKVVAWLLRNRTQGFNLKEAIVGAASNGHVDVLRLLLSEARGEQQQQQSRWALTLAAERGYTDCVALLRDAGWTDGHATPVGES